MNKNVEHILSSLLREVRQDVKSIRDTLAPMQVDLQYHIKRTSLNEVRIDEMENKLLDHQEKIVAAEEKKVRAIKLGIGIISGILGIIAALEKII